MIIIVEDLMTMPFATTTKNPTNGLCNKFKCIIIMVVINSFTTINVIISVIMFFTFWHSDNLS